MAIVRLATLDDVDELVQMRWDFSIEDYGVSTVSFCKFHHTCSQFLVKAFESGDSFSAIFHVPLEDPNTESEPESASKISANNVTRIMDTEIDSTDTNREYHQNTD